MTNKFYDAGKALILVVALVATQATFAQKVSRERSGTTKLDGPMLYTQKGVYGVGEKVIINGRSYAPFEMISVTVSSVDPISGRKQAIKNWVVYSDMDGYAHIKWVVPSIGRFAISAKGAVSKSLVSKTIATLAPPTPVVMTGNPSCADVDADSTNFPQIFSMWGFKLDFSNPNGTFPFVNNGALPSTLTGGAPADAANSVTVTTTNSGKDLAWSSTRPITAVIVKGGANANVYAYNPDRLADTGPLTAVDPTQAISHVEFCHQFIQDIKIIKHASPPSNFQFDFTSTGLATSNFSLVDNNLNSDPSIVFNTSILGIKTFTLTNGSPYTLTSIVCTQTGLSVITPNVAGRMVTINLDEHDSVTCTFTCDFVTAAEVSVSGRVLDPYGRPLRGATVSVTDSNGRQRFVSTNSFGFFRIDGLDAGAAYFFNAAFKGYRFSTRIVTLDSNNRTVNFIAAPR